MSDLFHADIPDDYIGRVFEVMLAADWHIYQVLTKRPARAARFVMKYNSMFRDGRVPPHIWLGTSVESQDVDYRINHLRLVPAATRFLSCEPLLGPLEVDLDGIHWVIVGGESGPDYRTTSPDWVTDIREQCSIQRVPFFFKQWGGRTPKAGGRLLDGQVWNQMPPRRAKRTR